MKQQVFETLRRPLWQRFADQLAGLRLGYRLPEGADEAAFVADYQSVARDLALARARGYSRNLEGELNDLVMRGHNAVYVHRSGFGMGLLRFLSTEFPRAVRRQGAYLLVAACCFVLPLLGTATLVLAAPEWVYSVMSADQASALEAMYDPSAEHLGRERQADGDFAMFAHYVSNNVSIAFQLFASGLLWGVGTLFFLTFNGVYIGAAAGHMIQVGYHGPFFAFVAGHGPFELTAIVLAGSAGLCLGHALIRPGLLRRPEALKRASRRAWPVIAGAAVMLVLAAVVEAFWSSSTLLPLWLKHGVGGLAWLLVLGYLAMAGRAGEGVAAPVRRGATP